MREEGIHKIEVHVAAVCVSDCGGNLRVLALRRANTRTLFPGLWEGVGGQLLVGESFEDGLFRHLREEAGLSGCTVMGPVAAYVIEPGPSGAKELIPGVRFLVSFGDLPQVTIDPRQHQDSQWFRTDALQGVLWIPGLLPQIELALNAFRCNSTQLTVLGESRHG